MRTIPTWQRLTDAGFLHRTDQQFHFLNGGYANYGDFLGSLASRKRKALRKERRSGAFRRHQHRLADRQGSDRKRMGRVSSSFIIDTGNRKWGRPYLNRTFFSLIGERMAGDILLVMAQGAMANRSPVRSISSAANGFTAAIGARSRTIPSCISSSATIRPSTSRLRTGLKVVEAGAQGEHKLARGYLPVTTHSAHYIVHPGLRRAVADYLEQEKRQVAEAGEILTALGPFRRGEAL